MAEDTRTQQHDDAVKNQATDDDALLATMRARFHQVEEAEGSTRTEELDDLRFSHGDQWPAEILSRRRQDNRPCLTINQMQQFVRQVTNEERQNRPAIRVIPVDDFADPETAKVFQGLIRHIESDSKADAALGAYMTSGEQAVRAGKGYFRIVTEYEDERSFSQVIKIKRIRNRFTVYMDPACQEADGSDANFCMIMETWSRDTFVNLYPDSIPSNMTAWTSQGDGWVQRDEVRVAEYFFKEQIQRTIVLLSDGTVHEERYLPSDLGDRTVVEKRQAMMTEVHWVLSNGYDVLERKRFPGKYIPIIPVVGDEVDINGKVSYSGLVRHAKDPQRMYNYWASAETETIALAPRAPYIGAEGSFEGHEPEWKSANTLNLAYLEYKPKSHGNELVPPPRRNVDEPAIQAITNARLMTRDDLKNTTGLHDASLGARTNETSGRAIVAKQREGDVATYHFPDNLGFAIQHAGRILVDIIPQIYNSARIVRILGEDDTERKVTLNAPFKDEEGVEQLFDMRVGRYDVVVDVGPSFASKRQEVVATMLDLTKAYPALFEIAGDLLVKNMDWPGAHDIAERLQALLPPEIRPSPKEGDPKAEMAQLRAAIPELQQKLEALNAYAQEAEQKSGDLEQENAQLKTAALSKAADLTVRQEENEAKALGEHAKLMLEEEKLRLEAQKIELEEQKLALEVAKAQAELNDSKETEDEDEDDDEEREAMFQAITEALQAVQVKLGEVGERLEQESEARRAPKQVSVTRKADGTLVGAISSSGGGERTLEIRSNGNGYTGEVE